MGGRIFWASVVGFLAGVFVRSVAPLGVSLAASLALTSACLVGVWLLDRDNRAVIAIAVMLCAAALGVMRMHVATLSGDPVLTALLGKQVTLEGHVNADPDVRDGSVRLSVDAAAIVIGDRTLPARSGVLAVLPAHQDVSYGDEVTLTGVLRAPAAFDAGVGRQFDYPSFLAAQGITYELDAAHIDSRSEGPGNPLKAFAIGGKHSFLRGLQAALPEPASAFAGGITVGDKRSIGAALTHDFQVAGLIHLLVLSGYNITVVINAAAWLLRRAPIVYAWRAAPFCASGGIVLLFVLMSGGASSAARAGLMALVAVSARFFRRTFLAGRSLAAAAVAIVAWNPFTLCFDPGFQLSALATAGLIAFTPIVASYLPWLPERWGVREIAASTIGTQIAVLPLLLYQNGILSLFALPANLLTLPFVPYAMLASLVAGLAGIVSGPLGVVAGLPAYLMTTYIISVTQIIAHLPLAGLAVPSFSFWWLVLAYMALFLGGIYLSDNKESSGRAQVPGR